MKEEHKKIALIGAGPIGLEMAVALKNAGLEYIHFDRGQIAQTISGFPRLMRFFSSSDRIAIAGVPIPGTDESKCTREEYLAYLRSIVMQFDLKVMTYTSVSSIQKKHDGNFLIKTVHKEHTRDYTAEKVIAAIGDMHEPNLLHIPGENLPHVFHYFDEPHRFFRSRVMVVGGRNSAVEAAIRCHRCGADVSISYRGAKFRPDSVKYWLRPEIDGLINRGEIEFYKGTVPREISAESVLLERCENGSTFNVGADFVLLMTGYLADLSLLENAGVRLAGDNEQPEFNAQTMETNVPGFYIAGTVTAGRRQKKYRVFIENCHIHVERIIASLTGAPPPSGEAHFVQPES